MFYEFNQNNSAGKYRYNDEYGISCFVIVEADSPENANKKAIQIGLYFDGCFEGYDCNCCGDRWYRVWSDNKGSEAPEIYGKPVNFNLSSGKKKKLKPTVYVHYADGRIVPGLVTDGCFDPRND